MGLVSSSVGEIVTIKSSGDYPEASGPWGTVTQRFDDTLARADEMLELLVGADGSGGYLGAMSSAIESAPNISINAPNVDTNITLRTPTSVLPVFDENDLGDYPSDTYPAPIIDATPAIDTSGLTGIVAPGEINAGLTWNDTPLSADMYPTILARILADLADGSTGINATVENAIYARAWQRATVKRADEYQKLNNDIAARGFSLPPGALLGALAEFSDEAVRMDADINNNIITTQADLAQKNAQFIIQQGLALEGILRKTAEAGADRALEYQKSKVEFLIRDYAERVRAFTSTIEGQKALVEAQVSALRGIIDTNKGRVEVFKEQYQALAVRIEAVASRNKAVTDVHLAQVQGYSEEQKAAGIENQSRVAILEAKVKAADMEVRAAIAEAEQTVEGYTSEMSLRKQLATEMANIASQSVASWAGAVNASASLGYSGSESKSESWGHSDSLNESHSYEHDPLT